LVKITNQTFRKPDDPTFKKISQGKIDLWKENRRPFRSGVLPLIESKFQLVKQHNLLTGGLKFRFLTSPRTLVANAFFAASVFL